MEPFIKNLSDITYMSELTPHPDINLQSDYSLGVGLIRAITYSHFVFVSYALIK